MNKKIVVLGGGESGVGAAILAKDKGMDVFLSDYGKIAPHYKQQLIDEGIAWEEGGHDESRILAADEVIKSPGIAPTAPIMVKIAERGIPVISEIEFAGRYTDAKMVCITGSNGKTTTTLLTYHILKNAGINVGLAGNVGRSLALQVAREHHDVYVIELSSFQLENMYEFKANIAVMLHLPALTMTDNINRIISSAASLGIEVRGLYGEGTKAYGNLYQISNRMTLGISEQQSIDKLKDIVNQLIEMETKARSALKDGRSVCWNLTRKSWNNGNPDFVKIRTGCLIRVRKTILTRWISLLEDQ